MKLYGYYRSSAAYRLRIALNLKGLAYKSYSVNLLKGHQRTSKWLEINPQGLVPVLELSSGKKIFQSMAILEWLEEMYTEVSLLPADPINRAKTRTIANIVACDIHPLDNLRVLKYLKQNFGVETEKKLLWYQHWIQEGFQAIEKQLEGKKFCIGDKPTLADVCLIPQVYNALRFSVSLKPYPHIQSIYDYCLSLPPFEKASPENQKDAL